MTTEEFENNIKSLGISRKEFAAMSGMSYNTVVNWHDEKKPIPGWVSSWLDNYKKSRKFDIIHKLFNEEINREKED